jgi:hypothetical protein
MKFISTLAFAASLAHASPKPSVSHGALYFLDSDPQGASVVSFSIDENGIPRNPQRTSTSGSGLIGMNVNGTVKMGKVYTKRYM